MAHSLVEKVRQAGVVGAGGAGFPTHVKLDAKVDTYLCNAAECEPLLCKDQELMKVEAERMIHGMRLAMESTGATRGVVAIKKKYKDAIDALKPFMDSAHGPSLEFYLYDNFYPAGDEYIVVYDCTGRLIPVGGLPLDVGCAVNNVETLINISYASEDVPVTQTWLTIAGAVREPKTVKVPVGLTIREVLDLAGGPTIDDYGVLDGGAMMGKLKGPDDLVTKTSGGYIVVPRDHVLVRRRTRSAEADVVIARSACDQCGYCTQFCPRYLLGYAIEPAKVMRSVGFMGDKEAGWAQLGLQCCECNLCSLYACPEDLPVMEMCVRSKGIWRQLEPRPPMLPSTGKAHPMREGRRVPIPRLVNRLNLTEWDVHAPFEDQTIVPRQVTISLGQHIGAPAEPVVSVGQTVGFGELVGRIRDGKLGANIHASMPGTVARVDETAVVIER